MKVSIVAPLHIQPSREWIDALEKESNETGADVVIIHDSWSIPLLELPPEWKVFDYEAQQTYLGRDLYDLFKQFHKSSAIKNLGLIYSYRENYDICIVIDSDCIVPEGFMHAHIDSLKIKGEGWINPIAETNLYSRGFPYSKRKQDKWCHMGLWTNELDLYGKDRIGNKDIPKNYTPEHDYNDAAGFFPLSGMNVSFVREALPYMLFLPNFFSPDGEKFMRHDDIWGGYIFQKIAQMKNKSLSYGLPVVYHDTIVHPEEDAAEEEPMYKYEDEFFNYIDAYGFEEAGVIWEVLQRKIKFSKSFKGLTKAFEFQSKVYANV